MTNIYQFEAELLDGKTKSMADYRGKVLLMLILQVNAVSHRSLLVWRKFTRSIKIRD
jgi:glutathione peroxidase-family protein